MLVVCAGLLGLTLALRGFEERGIVYVPADSRPIRNVPSNRFGVDAKLEEDVTQDQLGRDIAAIESAGFGWVRVEVQWSQLEPDSRGVFWDSKFNQSSWAKWDRIVAEASRAGLQVIARIDRPPLWSQPGLATVLRQHPDWQGPPGDVGDFGNVVAAFASRYRGRVRYIQVWNEPNLQNEWAGEPVNPSRYAALLQVAAQRARAASPDVVILAASLAPNIETGPRFGYANMSDLLYLQGLYAAGAAPFFDVAVANPYGLQRGPYDDRSIGVRAYQFPRAFLRPSQLFDFSRPIAMRQVMVRNGDSLKPIWAGEFGWNTVPADWKGNPSPWGSVTAQQQAAFTAQAYERASQEWPWMGVMNLWYLREPVDSDPRDPTPYFAILRPDWSPTPTYERLRALISRPLREPTGSHPATTPAAAYGFAGAWRSERSGDGAWTYQAAGAPESNLTFDFNGSVLGLVVRLAPNGGRTFVQIDGSPNLADSLPTDSGGNAYLDSYGPIVRDGVSVGVARTLPDGPHRLTAVIKGAKAPASAGTDLAIAAYVVGTRPWAGWSYALGVEALGVALCLGWVLVRVARWMWTACTAVRRLESVASGASPGSGPAGPEADAGPRPPGRARIPNLDARVRAGARAARGAFQPGQRPTGIASLSAVATEGRGSAAAPARAAPSARASGPRRLLRADGVAFGGVVCAGAIYYASPSVSLSVVALAVVAAVAVVRLDLALLLAVPAAPLAFLPKHVASLQLEPQETVILVCTGAWVVRGFWRGSLEIWWGRYVWHAIALGALGMLSLFAATYLRFSLRELRVIIIEPALWYVMLASVLTPSRRWVLADILMLTAVSVALVGLVGFASGHSVIVTEGVRRLASVYPSPDNAALLLDRIAPLAAAVAILGTAPRRWWYAAAGVVMLAAIALTFSKGSWLALAAACAVLGMRNRRIAVAGAFVLVGGIAAALSLPVSRVRLMGATSTERLWLWQAALGMIRDHPLRGIGLDQFLYLYPRYRLPQAWREPFLSHPHNVFLDFWLSLGVLGLLWLAATVARVARHVAGLVGSLGGPDRALAMGVGAGMAATLAHGLVDNSFFLPDLALVFWASIVLLGLLGCPACPRVTEGVTTAGAGPAPAPPRS